MIAKVSKGDPKLIDLPLDICERLLKQVQSLTLEEIFNVFNLLANTQEMSKRFESLRIPLEVSIVRLSYNKKIPEAVVVEAKRPSLSERPIAKEKVLPIKAEGPVNAEEPEEPPESVVNITLDNVRAVWQNIIDSLSRVKISAATYLSEGELYKLQGNLLTVSFPKSHSLHKESLEKRENREMIEKNLTEFLNTPLRVSFILSSETKPKSDDSGNTFIRSVMDVFGGRVVKEE